MNDASVELFETQRQRLLGIAYRMTGSVAEAEDIVQEAFIKWLAVDLESIEKPEGWLVKVTTRLALDHLKSARVKRRAYVGPWLPEPLLADHQHPEGELELDQSITMALLVVMDRLSPSERAAYILGDLFRFSFQEIGELLGKTASHCRKLASRAREKVGAASPKPVHSASVYHRVVQAFLQAVKQGDLGALSQVLKADVVFHADGGGKAKATESILYGFESVTQFVMKVLHPVFRRLGNEKVTVEEVWFNGGLGLVLRIRGKPVTAFDFQLDGECIKTIHAVRNPDKLQVFRNQT